METTIKNKIAVVTGGSRGIGAAIVEAFIKEGAKTVVLVDLDKKQGNETAANLNHKYGGGRAIFYKGDVTADLDNVYEEIIKQYHYVDILVNNAGIIDESSIRRTINVNTVATVEWSMKFLQIMRKDKGGKGGTILNMASVAGYSVDPTTPFYKASKYAVMGFTRTLGHDEYYKITGVRVIALCPGMTRTLFGKNYQYAFDFIRIVSKSVLELQPVQETENVANAAIEAIKIAKSGSAWNINNAEPIQEVI